MRGYEVYMFYLAKDQTKGKYIKSYSNACFAEIHRIARIDNVLEKDVIYIDQYEYPKTKEYIDLIVKTVNEITPCSIVDGYIRVQLLPRYDQSLIILNFIRALWNEKDYYAGYSVAFFKALSIQTEGDALERLLKANKIACEEINVQMENDDHSNCYRAKLLKIKNIKQLYEFEGISTRIFLTNQ